MLFRQPPQPSLTTVQFINVIDLIAKAYLGSKSYAFIREVKAACDSGCVFTPSDRQWLQRKILFVSEKLSSLDLQKAHLQEKLYTYHLKETDFGIATTQVTQLVNEIFSAAQAGRGEILTLLSDKKIKMEYCIQTKSARQHQVPGLRPIPEAVEALHRTRKKMGWLSSPLFLVFLFDVSLDARFFATTTVLLVLMYLLSDMMFMKELKRSLHHITRTIDNLADAKYEDLSDVAVLAVLQAKLSELTIEMQLPQQASELAEGRRLMAS